MRCSGPTAKTFRKLPEGAMDGQLICRRLNLNWIDSTRRHVPAVNSNGLPSNGYGQLLSEVINPTWFAAQAYLHKTKQNIISMHGVRHSTTTISNMRAIPVCFYSLSVALFVYLSLAYVQLPTVCWNDWEIDRSRRGLCSAIVCGLSDTIWCFLTIVVLGLRHCLYTPQSLFMICSYILKRFLSVKHIQKHNYKCFRETHV